MEKSLKKQIGVGMIGTGFMCRAHSNAYRKISWNYWSENFLPVLVGVGGISQEDADMASQRFGYQYGCVGWEKLMLDPDINLISIGVDDKLHKQAALDCIAAGKSVICEKPLALSVEDAVEMTEAAEHSKVKNMCGFNYRFLPAVVLAKRLIERGLMGNLYCFNGCYCQDQGADDRVPAEKLWYVKGSKASGVSNGIGSHLIDMSRYLMGEVGTVQGFTKTYNKIRTTSSGSMNVVTDEEMLATVEFVSGASGLYRASAVAGGRKNYFAWEINGSGGSMTFNTEDPNVLNVYLRDSQVPEINGFTAVNVTQLDHNHPFMEYFWPRGSGLGWEDAHVCELAHMLNCVANDQIVSPLGATFRDGLHVVSILEAIRESQRSTRRINLDF